MTSAQGRRVDRLEGVLGPRALGGDVEAWAAAYGWKQVYEWQDLAGRRAVHKLSEFLPGGGMEPVPDPTPDETRFHDAMSSVITPEEADEAMSYLREKLGVTR